MAKGKNTSPSTPEAASAQWICRTISEYTPRHPHIGIEISRGMCAKAHKCTNASMTCLFKYACETLKRFLEYPQPICMHNDEWLWSKKERLRNVQRHSTSTPPGTNEDLDPKAACHNCQQLSLLLEASFHSVTGVQV